MEHRAARERANALNRPAIRKSLGLTKPRLKRAAGDYRKSYLPGNKRVQFLDDEAAVRAPDSPPSEEDLPATQEDER